MLTANLEETANSLVSFDDPLLISGVPAVGNAVRSGEITFVGGEGESHDGRALKGF